MFLVTVTGLVDTLAESRFRVRHLHTRRYVF